MAGYLFSNKKLRDELSDAKNAEEAGKILAVHLQRDGKLIGAEVQKFVKSDTVQDNLTKAKKTAQTYAKKWRGDVASFMQGSKKKTATAKQRATKRSVTKKKA